MGRRRLVYHSEVFSSLDLDLLILMLTLSLSLPTSRQCLDFRLVFLPISQNAQSRDFAISPHRPAYRTTSASRTQSTLISRETRVRVAMEESLLILHFPFSVPLLRQECVCDPRLTISHNRSAATNYERSAADPAPIAPHSGRPTSCR